VNPYSIFEKEVEINKPLAGLMQALLIPVISQRHQKLPCSLFQNCGGKLTNQPLTNDKSPVLFAWFVFSRPHEPWQANFDKVMKSKKPSLILSGLCVLSTDLILFVQLR
jgi:hypothetical protein